MKAVYFDGEKAVYREDMQVPIPDKEESLIRILMSAVCNTDKEILRGYKPGFTGVMGHEFVGIVEDSPNPGLIGKRVVGELNAGCQSCLYCRTGREKHCVSRRVIGMERHDGCFAEYITLATHLIHTVPDSLPTEQAIFTEPLAAALEIPSMIHIDPAKNIAVIGYGRLAFMITQVLSLTGADVTVIGKHEEKLAQFAPYAHTALKPEDTYEYVVEATGSPSGLLMAKDIVRKQGTIILKSTYAGEISIDMSYMVVNEISIRGSRCGPFEPALNLLAKGLVKMPDIELYPLSEYERAFTSKAFKAGFTFDGSN